ncbi:MAG: aminotransferase class I/II-fold pyridoxal phosphate-dependent enzyme, partial [Flavisolibacter sp.]|nr:aminotransferase class I/II-fold pyridoxal phosphate-dependent enzyme [Flavisolibacter sp.]
IINGLSKGFAMTGWRLGYMAANAHIVKACEKLQGQFTSGTNSITQRAAITALTGTMEPTHKMVQEFERRRKRVIELMQEIDGFRYAEPDGAFYVFPDVSHYFSRRCDGQEVNDANDLAMYLLNTAHVSTVSGSGFGDDRSLRISFANHIDNIEKGFTRIKSALEKLH